MRKAEEANTFTLCTNYLEDYRAKFERHYKMLRLGTSTKYANAIRMLLHPVEYHRPMEISPSYLSEPQRRDNLLRVLKEFGLPAFVEDVLGILPRESANGAIEFMADIRAYWQGELGLDRAI